MSGVSVLVLGSTGNTGKPTVEALAASASVSKVHAAGRDEAKVASTFAKAGDKVTAVALDIADAAAVEKAVAAEQFDVVVIVPPSAETRGTLAAEAARAAVKGSAAVRVVLLSVPFADQKPDDSSILFHKQFYEAEAALREATSHWVSLQMTMFFENNLGSPIRKDGVLAAPVDGKAALAPVSVADIGASVVGAATRPAAEVEGKVFLLTGPTPISLTDQAKIFSTVFGKEVKYVNVPADQWLEGAVAAGWPKWQAEGLIELYAVFLNDLPAGDGVKLLTGNEPKDFASLAAQYKDLWAA